MKTAMQEFINELLFIESIKENQITKSNKAILITAVIKQALEKEKEQSIELIKQTAMFMAAAPLDEEIAKMSYEDVYNSYYNETYNQNEG